MHEVWGSNHRLGGLRVCPLQACGGISTLQSRAAGLQSTTQGNSIRTEKDSSESKQAENDDHQIVPGPLQGSLVLLACIVHCWVLSRAWACGKKVLKASCSRIRVPWFLELIFSEDSACSRGTVSLLLRETHTPGTTQDTPTPTFRH